MISDSKHGANPKIVDVKRKEENLNMVVTMMSILELIVENHGTQTFKTLDQNPRK